MTFFISGAVSLFGSLIFIILGEDGIANWAKDEDQLKEEPEINDQFHEEKNTVLPIYTLQRNSELICEKM